MTLGRGTGTAGTVMQRESTMEFALAPATSGATSALIGLSVLLAALAAMFLWFAWAATHGTVRLRDGGLQLDVPIYGRVIPVADLDLGAAQVVDLTGDSPLRPRIRSNGLGVPGYGLGWFRLADGSRALTALSRRTGVLHLPTASGYVLLISVEDPQALLAALARAASLGD